jgi:hypothetical protein
VLTLGEVDVGVAAHADFSWHWPVLVSAAEGGTGLKLWQGSDCTRRDGKYESEEKEARWREGVGKVKRETRRKH